MLVPHVRVVRCAPKSHPCPHCGMPGRRKRRLHRRIRSLAYLDIHYAEYQSRYRCCKFFRSWPLEVPAKSDYDALVRAAVLDRPTVCLPSPQGHQRLDPPGGASTGPRPAAPPGPGRPPRKRGRPSKAQQAARAVGGPTLKEKVGFILKQRFLIVKRTGELDKQQWDKLIRMFDYVPELRTLWQFACAVRGLFEKEARVQTLWQRRQALLGNEQFQAVAELVEAMALLEAGKFQKAVAFVYSQAAGRVRTNNHVEGANRRFRFTEKLRYKWRRRKWVLRFVLLALDRCWRAAAEAADQPGPAARAGHQQYPSPSKAAGWRWGSARSLRSAFGLRHSAFPEEGATANTCTSHRSLRRRTSQR